MAFAQSLDGYGGYAAPPPVEARAYSISSIEPYVGMSATAMNIPWDQRLTIWLDNLAIGPRSGFDFAFDLDQSDFGDFQSCMSGPGLSALNANRRRNTAEFSAGSNRRI